MPKNEAKSSPLLRGLFLFVCLLAFIFGVRSDIQKEYNRDDIIKQEIIDNMLFEKLLKTKKPSFYPVTSENLQEHIDVAFIRSLEGTRLEGYVPMNKGLPLGQSGVTIASGFDIGQRSDRDLRILGLSTNLIAKFQPYLGLKKWDAYNALKKTPLHITQAECDEINNIVFNAKVRGIIDEVGETTWKKLGRSLRTVLASVQFQYGDAKTRTPNFFKAVMTMDITSIVNHLKNFGDVYKTRRLKEASYLQMSMKEGTSKNA